MRKPESEFFIEFDNREQWSSFYGMEYIFRFPKDVASLDVVIAHAMRNTLISFVYFLTCRDSIRQHHDKWTDVANLLEMAARMIRGSFAGPLKNQPPPSHDLDDGDLGNMLDDIEGL